MPDMTADMLRAAPGAPTSLGPRSPRWPRACDVPGFWAPCLSALCFLHCVGMASLASWLPALAAFAEAAWVEASLLAISCCCAVWVLWRQRAGWPGWLGALAAAALAGSGLALHGEGPTRLGFVLMAVLQLGYVRRHRRRGAACCPVSDGNARAVGPARGISDLPR